MTKRHSVWSVTARLMLLGGIVILSPGFAGADTRLLRHPSYSNGKVAFSYLGSLWSANDDGTDVQRLTVNKARDIYPSFSPDGKWIAFSSNRAGNYDVYVMPAGGDKPRQLTFNSADDVAIGWTPDGSKVIFLSSRDNGVFPGVATLFEVPADGGHGTSRCTTDWGSWASYSPDGKKLAFTRHPGAWSRKHYRGSYAVDLWLTDVAGHGFTRLGDGDYKGNYLWPMYGNDGSIYFVADRLPDEKNVKYGGPEVMKSVNNIWKISDNGGEPIQVTHHTEGNLLFPSISADRRTIVYEQDHGLWKLDVETGKSSEDPDRHQVRHEGKRAGAAHGGQRGRQLQPLAVGQAGGRCHPRRDLHHRHRSRRSAARHGDGLARAVAAMVAGRKVDRVRLRPQRPRGGLGGR